MKNFNFSIWGKVYLHNSAKQDAITYLNDYYAMTLRLVKSIAQYDNQVKTDTGVSLNFTTNIDFYFYNNPAVKLDSGKIQQSLTLIDQNNNLNINAQMREHWIKQFQTLDKN